MTSGDSESSTGPLPVHVLTGFLGAGKTTLLGQWLRDPALQDTAVLVNEFGEVGLDHHLITPLDQEVVLLANGCVCCSIRGDLAEGLNTLLRARANGSIPPFRRVVVETTGLAEPAPICATVLLEPRLRHAFALGNLIACFDGVLGPEQLSRQAIARQQVAVADQVIVTKADLIDPAVLAERLEAVRALNANARLCSSSGTAPAPVTVLTEGHFADASRSDEIRRLAQSIQRPGFSFAPQSDAPAPAHQAEIRSVVLSASAPLPWGRFVLWLTMLLHTHGQKILRTKGILAVEGTSTPVVLHAVQHVVHPPLHLAEMPDGVEGSQIIMIVEGLDTGKLAQSFDAFVRSHTTPNGQT